MKISDLVGYSAVGATMAQVGLVLALVGFVALVVYVLARRDRATFDRARMMPLHEDARAPVGRADGDDGQK
jgi:cbb3-type cytochrome oxidase subunit 3